MADNQDTAHYVEQPRFVFFIRIAQVVIALMILGLVGYTINADGGIYINNDSASFVLFCSVWTFLVVGYLLITPAFFPIAYNCWAQLSAEFVACIFWFCGWTALSAAVGKVAGSYYTPYLAGIKDSFGLGNYRRNLEPRKGRGGSSSSSYGISYPTVSGQTFWKTAAVGAALSAIIWILFMVTFVFFVLSFLKHRSDPEKQHLPRSGVPYSGEKHEMANVAIGQVATPAPAYPQYPVPAQTPVYPVASPVASPPPQQWQQSPPPQQFAQQPSGQQFVQQPPAQQPYGHA